MHEIYEKYIGYIDSVVYQVVRNREDAEDITSEFFIKLWNYTERLTEDFYFAAAVAEFGLLVRDSEYKGEASFENVRSLLKQVYTESDSYKDEFIYLVKELQKNSLQ